MSQNSACAAETVPAPPPSRMMAATAKAAPSRIPSRASSSRDERPAANRIIEEQIRSMRAEIEEINDERRPRKSRLMPAEATDAEMVMVASAEPEWSTDPEAQL